MNKFNSADRNSYQKPRFKVFDTRKDFKKQEGLSPMEQSIKLFESMPGCTVKLQYGETAEQLVWRFKKEVEKSGVLKEIKRREHYLTPSEKGKEKSRKAQKKLRKLEKRYAYDKDEDKK